MNKVIDFDEQKHPHFLMKGNSDIAMFLMHNLMQCYESPETRMKIFEACMSDLPSQEIDEKTKQSLMESDIEDRVSNW